MARKPSTEKSDLSYAVVQLRKSFGDTQKEFAARLGLTPIVIARWETTRPPRGKSLDLLLSLAEKKDNISQYVFRKYLRDEQAMQSRFERFANNLKPARQNETCDFILKLMAEVGKYPQINMDARELWLSYLIEIGKRTTDLAEEHFETFGEILLGRSVRRVRSLTPLAPLMSGPGTVVGFNPNQERATTLSAQEEEETIISDPKVGAKKEAKRRKK